MSLENNPQNDIETKINHSGNAPEAMREVPENDFDNTSLREAVDQGLITVPETTEAVGSWAPRTETMPSTIEKKGFSKKQKLIAGFAGLSLAAVGFIGAKSMNKSDEQVAPVGPVATAPAVAKTEQAIPPSGEVAPNVTTAEGLAAFIDTYKTSGTTFEAVAKSFVDKNSAWLNTGLTIAPDLEPLGYGAEGMVPIVEAKYAGITHNLYTESGSAQAVVSDYEKNLHKDVIEEYWISWSRGDAKPYVHKIEETGFKLISSDNPDFNKATTFTADVITHVTDNGNDNVAQNRIEHGVAAQIDIIRDDQMTFVRESVNAPYKLDAKSLNKLTDNSK